MGEQIAAANKECLALNRRQCQSHKQLAGEGSSRALIHTWLSLTRAALRWILLMVMLSGCAVAESVGADPCADVKPGGIVISNIRPNKNGVFGFGKGRITYPWISQHSVFTHADQATTLDCIATAKGICTEARLIHVCKSETESPSSSSLMGMISSPVSAVLNHAVVPVVP